MVGICPGMLRPEGIRIMYRCKTSDAASLQYEKSALLLNDITKRRTRKDVIDSDPRKANPMRDDLVALPVIYR